MLRDEGVEQIRFWTNAPDDIDAQIVREIQLAQQELEKRAELPWFLLSEEATIPLTAGEDRVPLPSNFLREYNEEGGMWRRSTDGVKYIMRKSIRGLHIFYPQTEEYGDNEYYYSLDGNYFRIYPEPTNGDTIGMLYYKRDVVLSSNITNAWLTNAATLLLAKAAMPIASALRNREALKEVSDKYAIADRALDLAIVARREARKAPMNYESQP